MKTYTRNIKRAPLPHSLKIFYSTYTKLLIPVNPTAVSESQCNHFLQSRTITKGNELHMNIYLHLKKCFVKPIITFLTTHYMHNWIFCSLTLFERCFKIRNNQAMEIIKFKAYIIKTTTSNTKATTEL